MITSTDQALQQSLDSYSVASVEQLHERQLQTRYDRKFIIHQKNLPALFSILTEDHSIVHAKNQPVAHYKNLYFDTPSHYFLNEHLRGRRPRYKVRIRHYVERELSFVELKQKLPSNATVKLRSPIDYHVEQLNNFSDEMKNECPITIKELQPSLRTDFQRVTLLSNAINERATFDFNINFQFQSNRTSIPNLAIIELKQGRATPRSQIILSLSKVGAVPLTISKYCTGAVHFFDSALLKQYQHKLHFIRKIVHD